MPVFKSIVMAIRPVLPVVPDHINPVPLAVK